MMLSKVTRFAAPSYALEWRDRRAIAREWVTVTTLAVRPAPDAAHASVNKLNAF